MSKKINVLIFPCGAVPALEIHESLRYSIHTKVYGASSVEDYGRLKFDNYIGGVPNIKDNSFDETFSEIVKNNNIDVVFATHDSVHKYLSEKASSFDCYLVNGNQNSSKIARSKKLTYNKFKDKNWVPKQYDGSKNIQSWPVVCKPDFGQGSQGVTICQDALELESAMKKVEYPVIVEYLPGDELTVDCFTDRNSKLIWIGARTREKVTAGITMKSKLIDYDKDINTIAGDINSGLTMRGPWFFQIKKDINNNWKLLEISSRMAGTMVAQRAWGVNLSLMAIQDFLERDLVTLHNKKIKGIERSIVTKFDFDHNFNKVYIDFDDTIVINNHVEPMVMAFIFEMIKKGKEIILITRHENDIYLTLERVGISKNIFTDIIHLKNKELKSNYITEDSIFVDNHFPERMEVYKNKNIPVFDVDSLTFF